MEFIKIISACQGAFILGVTVVIFFYYIRIKKKDKGLKFHIVFVSASYSLITIATIISVYKEVYWLTDPWYWFVGGGYLFGDIALLTMLRRVVRRHNQNGKN